MNHFSSRAVRAFGALVGAATLSALSLAARADAPALKLLVRTTAFVPRVMAPDTSASAPASVRAARARLQGQLDSLVPGSFVGRSFNYVGWSVIGVPANAKSTAFTRLRRAFGAGNVEGEVIRRAYRTPNDPLFANQYGIAKVNAPIVWNVSTGSSSVIVAVLDTGADLTHPDLKDNLYKSSNGSIGYNAISPGKPPQDDNVEDGQPVYHGTHCAGNIGARGNNGRQAVGVNWNVKIIPVKIIGADGYTTNTSVIDGINFLLTLKAKGVNIRATSNSYGGGGGSDAEKEAFRKLDAAGILSVFAAGNGGDDGKGDDNDATPDYPAGYGFPSMLSVGASDSNDAATVFSNYGAKTVHVFAPGLDILSLSGKGGTAYLSGTSMACPIVAGGAALMWSLRPGLTAGAMKDLLINSAFKVAGLNGKCVSGGRLDLAQALQMLGPIPTPTPNPTPTPTPTPSPSLILSGTVYSTGKAILPGATVTLSNGLKTTSDASGAYVISGITAGNYNLTGTLSGYSFPSIPVNFDGKADTTRRQDLIASAPATSSLINGIVRNVQGRDTSGIPVLMNGETVPVAVSGTGGEFTVPNLPPADYTLSATVAGMLGVAKVTLSASGTLTLTPTGDPKNPTVGRIEKNKVILQPVRSTSVSSS